MKILSPAGNFESLKMAVYNGADEVYLGINHFNARNNIDGFTLDTLKQAIDFAHLFGVKVCLAINILFTDEELPSAVQTAVLAYNLGVDAFIIQDLGLAKILNRDYPSMTLHASTQMGLHNLEGVLQVLKYGFTRVVLARETPLKEIKRIKENCDIEIEYFAQGALCVSFSGNCYLSSYLLDASGNRGKCKQLCRLPYTLEKDGKTIKRGYLLSAKDINMTARLNDMRDAGVDVIKIEGRARRPYYVGVTTREYYKALNGKTADQEQLKLAFNRNFTAGYFDGNGNIISDIQNHIGIEIGKVEKVKIGKTFNEIFFNSNRDISKQSTLKFFDNQTERSTISAFDLSEIRKGVYRVTSTQTAKVGDIVRLITDSESEKNILSQVKRRYIKIDLYIKENCPIKAEFNINNKTYQVTGETLQSAKNYPLTEQEVLDNFSKSEYFDANINLIEFDKVFIQKQKLNAFRRTVFESVYDSLTKLDRAPISIKPIGNINKVINFTDFEFIKDLNQPISAKNAIYSPEEYKLDSVVKFKELCDKKGVNAYLDTPNFATEKDIEILSNIISKSKIGVVANNYYALSLSSQTVIGGGLNVYNSYTASEYSKPVMSAETNAFSKVDFAYMTLKHCPIKSHLNGDCKNCKYTSGYIYKMDGKTPMKLERKKISECTFYLVKA